MMVSDTGFQTFLPVVQTLRPHSPCNSHGAKYFLHAVILAIKCSCLFLEIMTHPKALVPQVQVTTLS
jgi:hypothetical protein